MGIDFILRERVVGRKQSRGGADLGEGAKGHLPLPAPHHPGKPGACADVSSFVHLLVLKKLQLCSATPALIAALYGIPTVDKKDGRRLGSLFCTSEHLHCQRQTPTDTCQSQLSKTSFPSSNTQTIFS